MYHFCLTPLPILSNSCTIFALVVHYFWYNKVYQFHLILLVGKTLKNKNIYRNDTILCNKITLRETNLRYLSLFVSVFYVSPFFTTLPVFCVCLPGGRREPTLPAVHNFFLPIRLKYRTSSNCGMYTTAISSTTDRITLLFTTSTQALFAILFAHN